MKKRIKSNKQNLRTKLFKEVRRVLKKAGRPAYRVAVLKEIKRLSLIDRNKRIKEISREFLRYKREHFTKLVNEFKRAGQYLLDKAVEEAKQFECIYGEEVYEEVPELDFSLDY